MPGAAPAPTPFHPRALSQVGPDVLRIEWSDGHVSLYPVVHLRRGCRCASCIDEWSGKQLLDPEKVREDVRPVEIQPVGRYALHFRWSDGHTSGIYTFEHLRALCLCAECRGKQG